MIWYGPYSREKAIDAAKSYFSGAIYMGIGKTKSHKAASQLQHVGITDDLHARLANKHYQLDQLTQKQTIWLGELSSYEPPGKNGKQKGRIKFHQSKEK